MRTGRLLPAVFVMALSILACTLSPMVSPPATQTPTATVRLPTLTHLPPTPTIYFSPSPVPDTPEPPSATLPPPAFSAEVLGERLNLREGPSTLDTITGMVPKGVFVSLIGKAPGNEWVFVENTEGKTGWLSIKYLLLHGNLDHLAELPIPASYVVEGQIVDSTGMAINGVDLAIYQGEGSNQQRTDATTDASGKFYAYLPLNAQGSWTVEVVGISCRSWIMDPNCHFHGAFSSKGKEVFQPPLLEPLYFVFENQVP